MASTLFDKIWDRHVVDDLGDGWSLLHIDRHLLHDLSGPPALKALAERGMRVRHPELVFATVDHAVSSAPGRTGETFAPAAHLWRDLRRLTREAHVRLFDLGEVGQGIVHVMGPELGLVLPGITLICGDSHTCTNGALGALAFGVGTSESTHALATQTLRQRKPRRMRVRLDGETGAGVTPKDIILYLAGHLGAAAGVGFAIEYAGSAVERMSIEGRLTICNLSIELGAKFGMIAPDETTFAYLLGRSFAPKGEHFDHAVNAWGTLRTDEDAQFDRDVSIDVAAIAPTVTWGTSPDQTMAVDGLLPDPERQPDPVLRANWHAAFNYMGLEPGQPIIGTKVDVVFIGSCSNSRISDLRAAAAVARGRRVADGVRAWVVPGSVSVKAEAEAEGLDGIFQEAGFEWRQPGCSMCVAANGEVVSPGARAVSTSNRNFVGRQGPGARTHLAGAAMAAAAAVSGAIVDVRRL